MRIVFQAKLWSRVYRAGCGLSFSQSVTLLWWQILLLGKWVEFLPVWAKSLQVAVDVSRPSPVRTCIFLHVYVLEVDRDVCMSLTHSAPWLSWQPAAAITCYRRSYYELLSAKYRTHLCQYMMFTSMFAVSSDSRRNYFVIDLFVFIISSQSNYELFK